MRCKRYVNLQVLLEIFSYGITAGILLYYLLTKKYMAFVTPRLAPFIYGMVIVLLVWAVMSIPYVKRPRYQQRYLHCLVILLPAWLLIFPIGGFAQSATLMSVGAQEQTYSGSGNTFKVTVPKGFKVMKNRAGVPIRDKDGNVLLIPKALTPLFAANGDVLLGQNGKYVLIDEGGMVQKDYQMLHVPAEASAIIVHPAANQKSGTTTTSSSDAAASNVATGAPVAGNTATAPAVAVSSGATPVSADGSSAFSSVTTNADGSESEVITVHKATVSDEDGEGGIDTAQRTITFTTKNFYRTLMAVTKDVQQYNGYHVVLNGFVVRSPQLYTHGDFMIARMAMTCCVADIAPIGVVAYAQHPDQYSDNSWYHVEGTLRVNTYHGMPQIAITVTHMEPIDQISGYVYP